MNIRDIADVAPIRGAIVGLAGLVLSVIAFAPTQVHAQSESDASDSIDSLDEITVTGRKREESLVDVPVSITVVSADIIAQKGLVTQKDLFDSTVGIDLKAVDQTRNGVRPGIRGIQAEQRGSHVQKVASFIDGIPMSGQSATLQFMGIEAVEIYRGPQSAAFGKSTFAGAINYVTADAAEEFEGKVHLRKSDFSEEFGLLLSGPLGDKFGYRVAYMNDEFAPSEWRSSDGYDMASRGTEQLTAKLNFEFSNSVYGELTYTNQDISDTMDAKFVLDPADCSGNSGIFLNDNNTSVEMQTGGWNCDVSIPARGIPRNNNLLQHFLDQYDQNISFYTAAAPLADTNGDGQVSSDEYLAQIVQGPGLWNGLTYGSVLQANTVIPNYDLDRERVQATLNFEIGDSLLQFMGMYVDEEALGYRETFDDTLAVFTARGIHRNHFTRAVENLVKERYAEIRWVSSDAERLRYTLSGSYYAADVTLGVYVNYGTKLFGVTRADGSSINLFKGVDLSDVSKTYAGSFGVQYDLTDSTTLSLEGRYQSDEVCSANARSGLEACGTTDSFKPRLSVKHTVNDNLTIYAQLAAGNNPAGVNNIFQDPDIIQTLQVASGQIASPDDGFIYDGSDGVHFPAVSYNDKTFLTYEEEDLTSFEIGAKGNYADGRGQFTTALYYMDYENRVGPEEFNWNDSSPNGWNASGWADQVSGVGENVRTTINSGDSRYFGLELETSFVVNDVLTVGGYLALATAEYTNFCSPEADFYSDAVGDPVVPMLDPDNGDDVLSVCGIVDGNTIPEHAKTTAGLNISALLPNELFGLTPLLRADLNHKGKYYQDHVNFLQRKATTELDLSAILSNDTVTARLFINNVTDVDHPNHIWVENFYTNNADPTVVPTATPSFAINPRPGREVGIQLSYSF